MTKLDQTSQGEMEMHIFRCYCGERSYLEIIKDVEDDQYFFEITLFPTRLKERLKLAWKAIRGLEFSASNEVVVDGSDIRKLVDALKTKTSKPRKRG